MAARNPPHNGSVGPAGQARLDAPPSKSLCAEGVAGFPGGARRYFGNPVLNASLRFTLCEDVAERA